ncbi:hypothetical protein [Photorhabdus caribbeanensis]|uniref:hypothetical protein n=1 Tax=Photorhabdus caribbeanensis TaxID=1004165 RepID=UPI001BD33FA4|nr:hypothetical protein [Photorhabdus caribbeanensis]MBS9425756.1 hypothetical protein [Photorhabdus caribbeanensis]
MKETEEKEKGEMLEINNHYFFVVNLTNENLIGDVIWSSSGNTSTLNVDGLHPATASLIQEFYPESWKNDYWQWTAKGRQYQLNCYDNDIYVAVVISDFGISVLPTGTSPDAWKW